jgi:prophage DNA circulation protein
MANPLFDNLLPATFRGVPFQVSPDGADLESGRRKQVHEYPQRDKPYAQDMGRATRRIDIQAFVIGQDYVKKANNLVGAMEEPGSGTLVHPWLGSMAVDAFVCRLKFDSELGVAKFSLSFVESGELAFPSAADSTAALSRAAAQSVETASVLDFASTFKVLKQISDVADKALTVYGRALTFLSNPAWALSSALGFGALPGNLASLAARFGKSLDLGWNYASLLNLSGKVRSGAIARNDATLGPTVRGLTRMALDPTLAATNATASTATKRQIIANQNAINANTRQLLLVQACALSSYLPCGVYDDTLAIKAELAGALDAEALQTSNDDLYQALMAARAAMWRDLTDRSRDSARLATITPPDVLPMLAIAYDYYEDAGRDLEVVARNRISHPGFVPVAALRVLSR